MKSIWRVVVVLVGLAWLLGFASTYFGLTGLLAGWIEMKKHQWELCKQLQDRQLVANLERWADTNFFLSQWWENNVPERYIKEVPSPCPLDFGKRQPDTRVCVYFDDQGISVVQLYSARNFIFVKRDPKVEVQFDTGTRISERTSLLPP